VAGDGGQSLTGVGGAGGSLSQLFKSRAASTSSRVTAASACGRLRRLHYGSSAAWCDFVASNNLDSDLVLHGGNGATGIIGGG